MTNSWTLDGKTAAEWRCVVAKIDNPRLRRKPKPVVDATPRPEVVTDKSEWRQPVLSKPKDVKRIGLLRAKNAEQSVVAKANAVLYGASSRYLGMTFNVGTITRPWELNLISEAGGGVKTLKFATEAEAADWIRANLGHEPHERPTLAKHRNTEQRRKGA